jgi:hypothetical protein
MLEDGTYDAMVFDVDETGAAVVVELTIIMGEHKGHVVEVQSVDWAGDPLDLLGIPATLRVLDGSPTVSFEP